MQNSAIKTAPKEDNNDKTLPWQGHTHQCHCTPLPHALRPWKPLGAWLLGLCHQPGRSRRSCSAPSLSCHHHQHWSPQAPQVHCNPCTTQCNDGCRASSHPPPTQESTLRTPQPHLSSTLLLHLCGPLLLPIGHFFLPFTDFVCESKAAAAEIEDFTLSVLQSTTSSSGMALLSPVKQAPAPQEIKWCDHPAVSLVTVSYVYLAFLCVFKTKSELFYLLQSGIFQCHNVTKTNGK